MNDLCICRVGEEICPAISKITKGLFTERRLSDLACHQFEGLFPDIANALVNAIQKQIKSGPRQLHHFRRPPLTTLLWPPTCRAAQPKAVNEPAGGLVPLHLYGHACIATCFHIELFRQVFNPVACVAPASCNCSALLLFQGTTLKIVTFTRVRNWVALQVNYRCSRRGSWHRTGRMRSPTRRLLSVKCTALELLFWPFCWAVPDLFAPKPLP